jgi:hypothetical protein
MPSSEKHRASADASSSFISQDISPANNGKGMLIPRKPTLAKKKISASNYRPERDRKCTEEESYMDSHPSAFQTSYNTAANFFNNASNRGGAGATPSPVLSKMQTKI